jgi:endonuclease YncB( thermonuclease family)
MRNGKHVLRILSAAMITFAVMRCAAAQPEISGPTFVQQDGTLRISGTVIHLYGIYIPDTEQACYTFINPPPCGTRASLALEFKISGDFVHCIPRVTNSDGSIVANCRYDGDDLSEWMLTRGWAVARPDAPFEYGVLEKIARSKGIGIWGIPIDNLPHR